MGRGGGGETNIRWIMDRANLVSLVFEGHAHPYKKNLMKVDGRTRISDSQTVQREALLSDKKPV